MPLPGSGPARRARRPVAGWLLRRRRAHATRRKSPNRRLVVAPAASLVCLMASFGAALAYLRPAAEGREPTLDELSALAERPDVTLFGGGVAERRREAAAAEGL